MGHQVELYVSFATGGPCSAGALFANQNPGTNVPSLATARLARAERCL